jgi:hypothetical protein
MPESIWAMFGTISGGDEEISPPACMERALSYLSEQDQHKFRKEFNNRAGDTEQIQHKFRELLAGAFLARQGFTPKYEPTIGGQTPDWFFTNDGVGEFFAEFRNFQSPERVRVEQDRALDHGGTGFWSGSMPENTNRLWSSLLSKAVKYKELANQTGLPYVLIVHGLFTACLDSGEVEKCILSSDGLFADYPAMSGVYHMYERSYKGRLELYWDGGQLKRQVKAVDLHDSEAGYRFDFYRNPNATRPTPWLTNGLLPHRFSARQA